MKEKVIITYRWIEIEIEKSNKENSTPINIETYLVTERVVEYIELLRNKLIELNQEIPKLNNNENT